VQTELDVLRDVCARLENAGIEYMLTGSLAMNYYATPRMTRDVDLVVAAEASDAEKFVGLFAPDYYVPQEGLARTIRDRGMFNLLHIDIVIRKDEPFRRVEFARRARVTLSGVDAWIVSKEDLILSKLVLARDAESELQRRDVRNLLSAEADVSYLRTWAPRLGVADLLERLLDERHES
jgi:hypothetical protein